MPTPIAAGERVRYVAPDRSHARPPWPGPDRIGTVVARPSARLITYPGETPEQTTEANAAYAEKTWIVLWDGATYGHHHPETDLAVVTTCPTCGADLSEPFVPGDPPVHEGTETDLWACEGIQAGRLSAPTSPNETPEVTG